MAKLTEDQLAEKDLIETVRTIVRLKHRIAARRELNDVEADIIGDFKKRVSAGKPYTPDLGKLVAGELQ